MSKVINYCFAIVYSASTEFLGLLMRPLIQMLPQLRIAKQLEHRRQRQLLEDLRSFAQKPNALPTCLLICSSAGEYEQAKPLASALKEEGFQVIYFFISVSGLDFAHRRQEPDLCYLAPIDSIWRWQAIYKLLQPRCTILVRYEFWPALISQAHRHSMLFLINASRSPRQWTQQIFILLQSYFAGVYVAHRPDMEWFESILGKSRCLYTGDTKFDRVLQRQSELPNKTSKSFASLKERLPSHKFLVMGSAWLADIEILCAALFQCAPELPIALLIAPHDLSADNLETIHNYFERQGIELNDLSHVLNSCTNKTTPRPSLIADLPLNNDKMQPRAFLYAKMGSLFELYSIADFAWIGGAMHHKIHNVLEASVFDARLAFGPRYDSQKEAVDLVAEGCAQSFTMAHDLAKWLRKELAHELNATRQQSKCYEFVTRRSGATQNILSDLLEAVSKLEGLDVSEASARADRATPPT